MIDVGAYLTHSIRRKHTYSWPYLCTIVICVLGNLGLVTYFKVREDSIYLFWVIWEKWQYFKRAVGNVPRNLIHQLFTYKKILSKGCHLSSRLWFYLMMKWWSFPFKIWHVDLCGRAKPLIAEVDIGGFLGWGEFRIHRCVFVGSSGCCVYPILGINSCMSA